MATFVRKTSPRSTKRWAKARLCSCVQRIGGGGNYPRCLSRLSAWHQGSRRRGHPSGELRDLARRRRSSGLGHQRFRRSGRDALRARSGPPCHQRLAGTRRAQHHRCRDCAAILYGYRQGLLAPRPLVLDRDNLWLRALVAVSEDERTKFWKKMDALKVRPAPKRYKKAIVDAMPERQLAVTTARRSAGTGSLGRPRWVGTADWRGAPVVREAKALVPSAWSRARGSRSRAIRGGEIANGRFRPLDPWFRIKNGLIVRRLSPNNRKIEIVKGDTTLFTRDMLRAMGFELANVHLGTANRGAAIRRDLEKRRRGWLTIDARKASEAIMREHQEWKTATPTPQARVRASDGRRKPLGAHRRSDLPGSHWIGGMSGWRGASKDDNIVSPSTTAHSTSLSHTLAINISRTSSLSSFVIRSSATLSVFPTPCRAACSKATLMRADMTDVAASSSSIRFPTAVSSRRPAGKDRQRRFSHVTRLAREARSRRLPFELTRPAHAHHIYADRKCRARAQSNSCVALAYLHLAQREQHGTRVNECCTNVHIVSRIASALDMAQTQTRVRDMREFIACLPRGLMLARPRSRSRSPRARSASSRSRTAGRSGNGKVATPPTGVVTPHAAPSRWPLAWK